MNDMTHDSEMLDKATSVDIEGAAAHDHYRFLSDIKVRL